MISKLSVLYFRSAKNIPMRRFRSVFQSKANQYFGGGSRSGDYYTFMGTSFSSVNQKTHVFFKLIVCQFILSHGACLLKCNCYRSTFSRRDISVFFICFEMAISYKWQLKQNPKIANNPRNEHGLIPLSSRQKAKWRP